MSDTTLNGKTIVITGASSGFGKGAARAFAREGAHLVLAARRAELLDELTAECQAGGAEAMAVPTDVSSISEMRHLADAAIARFGRIDVWINNAGVGAIGRFEEVPLADHVQVIETDLMGTLYGSWYAYSQFLRQGAGILINVSSELGRHTMPYFASYSAAKHGIVGLDDSLRQELQQADMPDVHVCTVLPTAHDTPFFDHAANYTHHAVRAPKPLHDPQDVVDALVRLAKDPKDEEIVGGDGIVKVMMKSLAPKVAESMAGRAMHRTQMEDAPPAEDTPGAVHWPVSQGRGFRAGRLDERR